MFTLEGRSKRRPLVRAQETRVLTPQLKSVPEEGGVALEVQGWPVEVVTVDDNVVDHSVRRRPNFRPVL